MRFFFRSHHQPISPKVWAWAWVWLPVSGSSTSSQAWSSDDGLWPSFAAQQRLQGNKFKGIPFYPFPYDDLGVIPGTPSSLSSSLGTLIKRLSPSGGSQDRRLRRPTPVKGRSDTFIPSMKHAILRS